MITYKTKPLRGLINNNNNNNGKIMFGPYNYPINREFYAYIISDDLKEISVYVCSYQNLIDRTYGEYLFSFENTTIMMPIEEPLLKIGLAPMICELLHMSIVAEQAGAIIGNRFRLIDLPDYPSQELTDQDMDLFE